jgi:hypothetical protein
VTPIVQHQQLLELRWDMDPALRHRGENAVPTNIGEIAAELEDGDTGGRLQDDPMGGIRHIGGSGTGCRATATPSQHFYTPRLVREAGRNRRSGQEQGGVVGRAVNPAISDCATLFGWW